MRYLTLGEITALHRAILDDSGGATGVRDLGAIESAIAQPRATFGGMDLHQSIPAKAAALAYSLALNHPFIDGNKCVAHAAMEVFLILTVAEVDRTTRKIHTIVILAGQDQSAAAIRCISSHTFIVVLTFRTVMS